jgi:hypothetical protein
VASSVKGMIGAPELQGACDLVGMEVRGICFDGPQEDAAGAFSLSAKSPTGPASPKRPVCSPGLIAYALYRDLAF